MSQITISSFVVCLGIVSVLSLELEPIRSGSFLASIEATYFRAVAAEPHIAPATTMTLAGINKKPLAGFGGTCANERQVVRDQQVSSRSNDGPQDGTEGRFWIGMIVKLQNKASVSLHQNGVAAGLADKLIQRSQSRLRDFAPVDDRPEDVVHSFAQFDGGTQSLPGVVGACVSALSNMVCVP